MQAMASSMAIPVAGAVPGGMMGWPQGPSLSFPVMNNVNTPQGMTTAALVEVDPLGAYDGIVLFQDATTLHRALVFLATAFAGRGRGAVNASGQARDTPPGSKRPGSASASGAAFAAPIGLAPCRRTMPAPLIHPLR